eukprot:6655650-Prymnesium_polylepis.1
MAVALVWSKETNLRRPPRGERVQIFESDLAADLRLAAYVLGYRRLAVNAGPGAGLAWPGGPGRESRNQ